MGEALLKAQRKYRKNMYRTITVEMHKVKDRKVLEALDKSGNKQKFVRTSIEYFTEQGCPGWDATTYARRGDLDGEKDS